MLDTSPNTFWLSIFFFLILNEKEEKLYII